MQRSGAAAALRSKAMARLCSCLSGACSCTTCNSAVGTCLRPGNFLSPATLITRGAVPARPPDGSPRVVALRPGSPVCARATRRAASHELSGHMGAKKFIYLAYSSVSKSVFENTATSSPSSSDTSPTDGSDAGSTVKRGGSAAARLFNSSKVGIRSPL